MRQAEAEAARFAACLLAAGRAPMEAYVRAQPGTSAERAAFAPLEARSIACMVGKPIDGDRLRAALSLMLWAPAQPA